MNIQQFISGIHRRYDRYVTIPMAHRKFSRLSILNSMDSIRYIINNRCSVSRYGDGEFYVLMGRGNSFQHPDVHLAERLKHALTSNDAPNHCLAIPYPLKDTSRLRPTSKEFWDYFTMRHGETLLPFLSLKRQYLDTQLSRFYIMYQEKSHCKQQLELLKKIWDNRDIVIIEGEKSRTGVGNDLYTNAKSVQRILGPATDAFKKYDQMLTAIKTYVQKDKLILLSYGMTATVLAYDLAKLGYWAIDIGHLDIEYEWFRSGVTIKTAIKGKFTNEARGEGGNDVNDCEDKEYLSQIICNILNR